MKDSEKKLTLSNGVEIPILGFGTYKIEDDEIVLNSVREAIKTGYRHIDTASFYKNEENVGNGINEELKFTGLKRENIFVTT